MCGTGIPPNPAGMCVDCIRSQVRHGASREISTRHNDDTPPHFTFAHVL
jgi:hypothetical protein